MIRSYIHTLPHYAAQPSLPSRIAQAYRFPLGTGAGATVGIVELGGGYVAADISAYLKQQGLPAPQLADVSIDGGKNAPGDDADAEVQMDIEIVASIASAAAIRVYFAPNDVAGAFANAVGAAATQCDVVSVSWGAPENEWTPQDIQSMELALGVAAKRGVPVFVAAGDAGYTDGEGSSAHVDYPASSPHAIGCGGTRLELNPDGSVRAESAWNSNGSATGGGYSAQFKRPGFQHFANPMRGVPDVAGNADPETGYLITVDGQLTAAGGTSAVAPLWAALYARCKNRIGGGYAFQCASLYAHAAWFRDITQGSNGLYQAAPGWDACTGLGVPSGRLS